MGNKYNLNKKLFKERKKITQNKKKMELKTMQYEKSHFYNENNFETKCEPLKKTNFEIQLFFEKDFYNLFSSSSSSSSSSSCYISLKNIIAVNNLRNAAIHLSNMIETKTIHRVGICLNQDKNQYSVLLGLMPSLEVFKSTYKARTLTQNTMITNNFQLDESSICGNVYFYTMTQLQAFGLKRKDDDSINCFIGLKNDATFNECFELLLNTLGRIPAFRFKNKIDLSYISVLSLCTYKSENTRSNSSEDGGYFSIDHGKNSIGPFLDDDSLEWKISNNDVQNIHLLEVLGYDTPNLYYSKQRYTLIKDEPNIEISNNYSNNNVMFSIIPNLPKGLEFDSKTGKISGKPQQISENNLYTINLNGTSKKSSLELQVKEQTSMPSISSGFINALVLFLILIFIFAAIICGYKTMNL